jgi:branched-chain amino acid transport system substrate-binding protein
MRKPHLVAGFVMALALAGCAPAPQAGPTSATAAKPAATSAPAQSGGGDAGDIVIGTSLPLSGPLAPFGPLLQVGYQKAIDDVNAAGGLSVGAAKRKVQLVILDNRSEPNDAADQARTLYQRNNAVAVLGAATPPLNIPISNVAEQLRRPMVTTACPIRAWLSGKPDGWKYSWDMFFDELQMTDLQFQASDLLQTNKKVALFTDTEEDGVVMGDLWEQKAPTFGYQVAYHAKFPVGTNNFSSQIDAAKSAQAQVLIAQMVPPDAVALWKQMKALGYQPMAAFCEKCGNNGAWHTVLGDLSEGTSLADWWSASLGYPESQQFVDTYAGKTIQVAGQPAVTVTGQNADLSAIVAANTAARVLLDAISSAGSTSPDAINTALAQIDKSYPAGPVKFGADHTASFKAIAQQWTGNDMLRIYPAGQGAVQMKAPVPGLAP